jgi:hypothetical protein
MTRMTLVVALVVALGLVPDALEGQLVRGGAMRDSDGLPIVVRPGMLAAQIGELAGYTVRVPYARVVGVFSRRAFLVDTSTRLPPVVGHRARVLVLVDGGELGVPEEVLVASTVVVAGVARTLLGMRVSAEAPWPTELDAKTVERLEIRAGILARSVQTAEGVELAVPRR